MDIKLLKNLSRHIICLLFSIIIWITVKNIISPMINGSANVLIDIANKDVVTKMEKSYKIQDVQICKVNYKISPTNVNGIRNSDFKVYVDLNELSDFSNNEAYLPVHCDLLNGIDKIVYRVKVEPKEIKVSFDDVMAREFPINYNIVGELPEGNSVGDVELSDNVVYVSGMKTIVNTISSAYINIPINSNEEKTFDKAKVYFVDANGKEINVNNLEIGVKEVNYSIAVYKQKNIEFKVEVTGNVRKGYTMAEPEVNPKSVIVSGLRSVVDNTNIIKLPTIDVNDATENMEFTFPISSILPESLKCSDVDEVKVNIAVNYNIINNSAKKLTPLDDLDVASESNDNIKSEQKIISEQVEE